MAATAEARRLTESHRLEQVRLGRQVVAAVLSSWPLLDPDDLDGTTERWLAAVLPVIENRRRASARLAANYIGVHKTLELGRSASAPATVLAEAISTPRVTQSLLITGPVHVKSALARGLPVDRAMDLGRSTSAAAGMRHSLDGGRETTLATLLADDDSGGGWRRVTSGNACDFCSVLAGRGAVYSEDTADFASHDSCACSAEPVWGGDRRGVREFTGSRRRLSEAQRAANNARIRRFIAERNQT